MYRHAILCPCIFSVAYIYMQKKKVTCSSDTGTICSAGGSGFRWYLARDLAGGISGDIGERESPTGAWQMSAKGRVSTLSPANVWQSSLPGTIGNHGLEVLSHGKYHPGHSQEVIAKECQSYIRPFNKLFSYTERFVCEQLQMTEIALRRHSFVHAFRLHLAHCFSQPSLPFTDPKLKGMEKERLPYLIWLEDVGSTIH